MFRLLTKPGGNDVDIVLQSQYYTEQQFSKRSGLSYSLYVEIRYRDKN